MLSVLIITRNRTALLQKCLESLAPWALTTELQACVVVNGEDAATRGMLEEFARTAPWLEWRETMALPPGAARNVGLPLLRGEWVFFLDDDATLPPGYPALWQQARALAPDADVLGGPDAAPPGMEGFPRAVSLALASPLCTGPTAARHNALTQGAPHPADETTLTSCNLWVRREWFERGLRFPDGPRRGEETVLLRKLARAGAKIVRAPSLVVWHRRRESVREIARASFWGGFHRARIGGPWWLALPALFVLLHAVLPVGGRLVGALAGWWAFPVGAYVWLACVRARRPGLWAWVFFLHWLVPTSYGVGLLAGFGGRRWK